MADGNIEDVASSNDHHHQLSVSGSDEDETMAEESQQQASATTSPNRADLEDAMASEEVGTPVDPRSHAHSRKTELEHDTEMVSEDELSVEGGKAALETEEVSDEELPASIIENLETEAVSDDELPPLGKRRKKAPSHDSNGSEKEVPVKKGKMEKSRSRSPDLEGSGDGDRSPSAKPPHPAVKSEVLPELEKFWKPVNEDPTDFTGWTYLLQYVDQQSDVEAAREVYDAFLALYPYCYGYWRKYAEYEKRKGDKQRSEQVYLRGLEAIPLSVDLWLTYLGFCKTHYNDNEQHIRNEFDRAIQICGLEFRSDRLWDCYIKWETELKHYNNTFALYEKLLTTPTQGYKAHFKDFEEFVRSSQPNKILNTDEFLSLRSEVLQKLKSKPQEVTAPPSAAPPGDDDQGDEHSTQPHADAETTLIRERIISSRKKLYKETVNAVLARWNYEEGIKRPYFHVKQLERSQLNTWKEYLDFEISQGDRTRTIILFERCLIACALYEEFWLKFIKYLEELSDDMSEKIRDVYKRACLIHHPKKPYLALSWATFEENRGNVEEARKILEKLEENSANLLHVSVRRINLERRAGNLTEAANLYESYIANVKSKANFIVLSIKYARFCSKILKETSRGIEVLRKAIDKDPDNPRLYSQLLELTLIQEPFDEEQCVKIFDEAIANDKMDVEYRRIFAQRKIEFLEDFGSSIKSLRDAQSKYNDIMKQLRDKKKAASKHELEKTKQDDACKMKGGGKDGGGGAIYSTSGGGGAYSSYMQGYDSGGSGSGQYGSSQQSSYQQQPFGQYPQSDQAYSATAYHNWGYSQTTGYGNYSQNWAGYNYYS